TLPPKKGNANNTVSKESESAASRDGKVTPELTTAERQEVHMRKGKLINVLDEVEQRYMQYNQKIQVVISAFHQAATTYTALALQTISKQFRSLKDAIASQIKAANRSLGEEETPRRSSGSKLKFVDNHLRQQIGMMQHNACRPQRGLPERSVSVLRAWLFEHFLHPYPKDSDKHMLAKHTGLTKCQVSNWFINARVRLWKPMVEEMYIEEMKDKDSQLDHKRNKLVDQNEDSSSKSVAFHEERQSRDGYSFMGGQTNLMGAFGQYPIAEIGARFDAEQLGQRLSGNGVSLSLGQPHCENLNLSAHNHSFLPNHNIQLGRSLDEDAFGAINGSAPHSSTTTYESINIQNRKGKDMQKHSYYQTL
ncbi:BEL1-like homeodomain protein 1, partial [Linum grandiflorum]